MRPYYTAIFLVALTTLAYQVLLTRIFSVTMWYHYAFMAISIAMFGMTVGALLVYLRPERYSKKYLQERLITNSLRFSASIVISFVLFLVIPVVNILEVEYIPTRILLLGMTYFIISIPFIFSGILITLFLTKFKQHVSRLYAADLFGAALGAFFVVYLLNVVTAPSGVFILAGLAALPIIFLTDHKTKSTRWLAAFLIGCFIGVSLTNNLLSEDRRTLLSINFVKGFVEDTELLFERWNSYSRVTVSEYPETTPFGWGFSSKIPGDFSVEQKMLLIDAGAGTVLTRFDDDLAQVDYLKYDISNLPHYIRKDADVMVIGAGGGRDILSTFVFDQKSVTAAEINSAIIEVTTDTFADYIGNIMDDPRVTIVNDEARSYLSRTDESFDIVQISLIDTWAATAAGAFVLSENALYTSEAWHIFFDRLNPEGVLSVSRWHNKTDPFETYRIASLAAETLRQRGIKDPRQHIIIYRADYPDADPPSSRGVATVLVSPDPFTANDLETLDVIANELDFEEIISPGRHTDEVLATLLTSETPKTFLDSYTVDLSAPSDNKPFFFNMIRPKDFLRTAELQDASENFNLKAIHTLMSLLVVTIIFAVVFIIGPLLLKLRHSLNMRTVPYLVYFTSIGMGFMVIEVGFLQRLAIFLGHPIYSLTVVLAALLLAGGLGSYLTARVTDDELDRVAKRSVSFIVFISGGAVVTLPFMISALAGVDQIARIVSALFFVSVSGVFMGTAFPLGMRIAQRNISELTPFLWGVNGATSVVASVLAVVISMMFGITATLLFGVMMYVCAFLALCFMK